MTTNTTSRRGRARMGEARGPGFPRRQPRTLRDALLAAGCRALLWSGVLLLAWVALGQPWHPTQHAEHHRPFQMTVVCDWHTISGHRECSPSAPRGE